MQTTIQIPVDLNAMNQTLFNLYLVISMAKAKTLIQLQCI